MKDVQKISYANGYLEEIDTRNMEKKEENKKEKEKFYKNSIGVEINKFFINAFCLSYERFFKKNTFSIRIPVSFGRSFFGNPSRCSVYSEIYYNNNFSAIQVSHATPLYVPDYAPYYNGIIWY